MKNLPKWDVNRTLNKASNRLSLKDKAPTTGESIETSESLSNLTTNPFVFKGGIDLSPLGKINLVTGRKKILCNTITTTHVRSKW